MKKIILSIMAVAMVFATSTVLTSCGSDNNGSSSSGGSTESLPAPAHAKDAMKFKFSDPKDTYKSIEFTESGLAVLVKSGEDKAKAASRGSSDVIITGTYVVVNGAYQVDLPDTKLTVEKTGDKSVKINGTEYACETVTPQQGQTIENMARTWVINPTAEVDGVKVDIRTRREFIETGYPAEITITKAGSVLLKLVKITGEPAFEYATFTANGTTLNVSGIAAFDMAQLLFTFAKTITIDTTINGTKLKVWLTQK